jgi:hypothetical protein
MICGLLERSQHECRVLKLGDTESCNTQNFALEAHDISEQHSMSRVYSETVRLHCVTNLICDGASGSFDAQNGEDIQDMVGDCLVTDNT